MKKRSSFEVDTQPPAVEEWTSILKYGEDNVRIDRSHTSHILPLNGRMTRVMDNV